jgi:hypothetical protein
MRQIGFGMVGPVENIRINKIYNMSGGYSEKAMYDGENLLVESFHGAE